MRGRLPRFLTAAFFAGYTVAVIWPGVLPFNRVRPLVLGLPFAFFWVAVWVVLAGLVLWALDRAEHPPGPRARPE